MMEFFSASEDSPLSYVDGGERERPRLPTSFRTQVNLIAAVGKNGQLGLNGHLPWKDPEDLRFFKHMTMNDLVIVGHNTFQTLPILPGRTVMIDPTDRSPEDVIATLSNDLWETVWIAGGAKTYARWMPYIRRFFITQVDYDGPADVYMPQLWGYLS